MGLNYFLSHDITTVVIIQPETDQISWETKLDMPQRTLEEYLHQHNRAKYNYFSKDLHNEIFMQFPHRFRQQNFHICWYLCVWLSLFFGIIMYLYLS